MKYARLSFRIKKSVGWYCDSVDASCTMLLNFSRVIVLADIEASDDAVISKCVINEKDGKYSYEVEVTVGESQYVYNVDASTGEIIEAGEIIPE